MNTDFLLNAFAGIDDDIVLDAGIYASGMEKRPSPKRGVIVRWAAAAACFAVIAGLCFALDVFNLRPPVIEAPPVVSESPEPSETPDASTEPSAEPSVSAAEPSASPSAVVKPEPPDGERYASIDDIEVTLVNPYPETVGGGGTGSDSHLEMWEINGAFYFSMVTRVVGDPESGYNVGFQTYFYYDPTDGSCIRLSDEVRITYSFGDRFYYFRTNPEDELNWATRVFYSNNTSWDDEQIVDADFSDANDYVNYMSMLRSSGITEIDDKTVSYELRPVNFYAELDGQTYYYSVNDKKPNNAVSFPHNQMLVTIDGVNSLIDLDIESILGPSRFIDMGEAIGIANEKVYFFALYEKVVDTAMRPVIFSVELDGSNLKLVAGERQAENMSEHIILDNGYIYYHYRGSTSYLMRLDTATDTEECVLVMEKYVWQWVTDGEYMIYNYSTGGEPDSVYASRKLDAQNPSDEILLSPSSDSDDG